MLQTADMAENFIKEWRKHRRLTLQKLGDRLDPPASAGTMSAYESGKREISQDRLRQIAAALGTTPGRLLDMPPEQDVPAEVVDIWSRIPQAERGRATRVLAGFIEKTG